MGNFINFWTSFDIFGEAVGLNYKGNNTYKTALGALFSIVIKCFIIVFFLVSLVERLQFADPQITQVSFSSVFFYSN